jgi:hypothetical protein
MPLEIRIWKEKARYTGSGKIKNKRRNPSADGSDSTINTRVH